MKRLPATLLALALAAATGVASGQSFFNETGGQPYPDRYGQSSGAVYDYARVIRVDPVIDSGYGYGYGNGSAAERQRCYARGSTYAGNGGSVDRYGRDGYMDGYRDDRGDRYNDRYGRDDYYDNDRYGRDDYYGNERYGNDRYGSNTGSTVASVIGGLVGAAIGSQVGGGSGRYATSAIGSIVGGIAGRQIYEASQRDRYRSGTVQVCDPVPVNSGYGSGYGSGDYRSRPAGNNRVTGYNVTYEYAGRQFQTRTDYHPGDRIRVRVDVRPE